MTPNLTYTQHIENLKDWLNLTAAQESASADPGDATQFSSPSERDWCTLELTSPLTAANIVKYFDNTDANKFYQDQYDLKQITNVPVAFHQVEADNLYSLQKMFIYRHQPRLKNYRDDCENKAVRTYSSLSISLGKLAFLKSSV